MAVGFNGLPLVGGVEADAAFAVFKALLDDGVETGGEFDDGAVGEFASGADEGAPGVAELFGEKDFDAAGVAGAMADKAGLKDARVVEDEEIVLLEVGGQVSKLTVLPGLGGTIKHQHAGAVSFGGRILGNQLLGQFIIKG